MIVKKSYLLLLTLLVIFAGCRDRTQVTVSDIRPRETNSDHLQQALQIIDDLDAADLANDDANPPIQVLSYMNWALSYMSWAHLDMIHI